MRSFCCALSIGRTLPSVRSKDLFVDRTYVRIKLAWLAGRQPCSVEPSNCAVTRLESPSLTFSTQDNSTCSQCRKHDRDAALETSEAERRLAGGRAGLSEAFARGLRVIEAFGRDRRRLTLSDVARLVDLPRASVRRTCTRWSVLAMPRPTTACFRLTPRVLTLAGAYLSVERGVGHRPAGARALKRRGQARPARLAVLDGDEVTMIAHASPNRILPVSAQIGFRLPALSSSLGRVLLAALDDRELRSRARAEQAAKADACDRRRSRRHCAAPSSRRAPTAISLVDRRSKRASARFRCRCGGATAPSSPRSTSACMATAGRPTPCQVFLPKLQTLAAELRSQMI